MRYGVFPLDDTRLFKAVPVFGRGSVIIALTTSSDMRKMGNLRKYMPITYLTVFIGALANAGFPPLPDSSRLIIEALIHPARRARVLPIGRRVAGVFVARYIRSALWGVFAFHGKERYHDIFAWRTPPRRP